jgi:hypothetical protein
MSGRYYCHSDGRAYAKVYQIVETNQQSGFPYDILNMSYSNDIAFGFGSSWRYGFISEPHDCSGLMAYPAYSFEQDRDFKVDTEKPVTESWDSGVDWSRYGGLLSLKSRLNPGDPTAHLNEHQISHPQYTGKVKDKWNSSLDWYVRSGYGSPEHLGNLSIDLLSFTNPYGAVSRLRGVDLNADGFITFEQGVNTGGDAGEPNVLRSEYYTFVNDMCRIIAENGGEISYQPIWYWTLFTRDVTNNSEIFLDRYHIDIEYEFEQRCTFFAPDIYSYRYRVHIDVVLYFDDVFGVNSPFDGFDWIPYDVAQLVDNSTTTLLQDGAYPGAQPVLIDTPWHLSKVGRPGFYSSVAQPSVGAVPNIVSYRKFDRNYESRRHDVMNFAVHNLLPHLRPSSFYSSSDALTKHIEGLKANHLENLSQLGGLLELLPNLRELPRLAGKALDGDISVVPEIIDYLSDAILKFRFAQAPTAGDAVELATTDLKKHLEDLFRSQSATIYGVFNWDFPDPNPIGQGKLTLVTRSKVRVHLDLSTLLANYLSLNAVGLLPTLSRVWETLPFTFVVDWFTNMSGRLKQVDNQLLWIALRTSWCLHSYKVTYYPHESELEIYNLESFDPEDPFGLSVYIREFTRCTPQLRDSKFDFLAPKRGPNALTAGALIWSAVR